MPRKCFLNTRTALSTTLQVLPSGRELYKGLMTCAFLVVLFLHPSIIWSTEAKEGESVPASQASRGSPAGSWLVYRGDAASSGVSHAELSQPLDRVWKKEIPGGAFEATAVIASDVVYVGDLDNTFYAIDLNSGETNWTVKQDSGFRGAAGVLNDRIYVGDMDGVFHCFAAQDGKELWKATTGSEINSAPGFYKDNVLIGSQDGFLYCLNAVSGAEVWKYTIENMIQCSVTIASGKVFLAGCDGILHVVDVETGAPSVKVPINSETKSTPAAFGDLVVFGTYRESVVGVNWSKGEVQWIYRNAKRSFPFTSSAAMWNDLAIIGGEDKHMYALNVQTGEPVWTFATRGKIESSPVIVEGKAFFGSSDGKVYALDAKTGTKTWEYEAGGKFVASPAVASGRIVIGNQSDGGLYCFGAKK